MVIVKGQQYYPEKTIKHNIVGLVIVTSGWYDNEKQRAKLLHAHQSHMDTRDPRVLYHIAKKKPQNNC